MLLFLLGRCGDLAEGLSEVFDGVFCCCSGSSEEEAGDASPCHGSDERGNCGAAGMEKSVEFVDVVGRVSCCAEERVDEETAETALDDHGGFALNGLGVVGWEGDGDVDHGAFVFVSEEGEDCCWLGQCLQLCGTVVRDTQVHVDAGPRLHATCDGFFDDPILG